jgi:hypothetical protein
MATSRKSNITTGRGAAPAADVDPQNYDVIVTVTEPEPKVFYVSVNPERVQLNGYNDNTITWTLQGDTGAIFKSANDIDFRTVQGKGRFKLVQNGNTIVGTVKGTEANQIIYTYLLTVHFPSVGVALRIDPEVDNPPPVPR